MTKTETTKILAILKSTYPNFYKDVDVQTTIEIWNEMFTDCEYQAVSIAVKELINTLKYPPTIADIKEKMYELTHHDESSLSELWDKLLKAIRNGYYGAEEEFKKLPDEVKEFVKSPIQLREMAGMDSNTINSVVKGQFLRQIEAIKQKKKDRDMMLPETKKMLAGNQEKLLGGN